MHFELDRRLTPEELADLEDAARHVLATVRARRRRLRRAARGIDRLTELAREGTARAAAARTPTRSPRSWTGLRSDHFVFLGYREDVRDADGRLPPIPGTGLGLLREQREAGELRVPAHDPAGAADVADGEVLTITKTHALSPVHRREPMNAIVVRTFDADGARRRRGAAARPVHLARLRRAGVDDAAAARQAAPDPRRRGPDRGLARLQGRDHALRRLPQGRAVLRADRGPARARSPRCWRCDGRRGPPARPPRRATAAARRSSPPCRASATAPRCASGCAAWSPPPTAPTTSSCTRSSARTTASSCTSPSARAAACPTSTSPTSSAGSCLEARTWGDRVGATRSCTRPAPSAARMLAARWLKRLPESYRAAVEPRDRGRGRRALRGAGHRPRRLPGRPAERARQRRRAHPRRVLPPRAEGRALAGHADARAPRAARHRGGARRGCTATTSCGSRRSASSGRAATRRWTSTRRRPRGRRAGGRLARRHRVGLAEPAGRRRRPALAAGAGAARLPPLPPADRLALHRVLPERRHRRQPGDHRQADPAFELRFATDERGGDAAAEEALREEIRDDLDAVELLDHDRILRNQLGAHRRDRAHQRVQAGPRRDGLQAALADVPGDPAARAAVRDLRLRARHGGHPPARRQDRARRHPLVGPHGLPHRGLRPHARADDQERDHRPGRAPRAGSSSSSGPTIRPRCATRSSASTCATSRRCWTSPTTSTTTARPSRPRRARPRRGRLLPRRRGRQGHRGVQRHRQRDRACAAASGWATRSPPAARPATTTRAWASPPRAPGSRSSATSASWASTPSPTSSAPSASATCRATCSATACCSAGTLKLVAAYDHRHVFLDPDPDPERRFAERRRLFDLAGSSWDDYDRDAISEGGGVFSRNAKRITLDRRRCARRSASRTTALAPTDLIRAILRAPVDLLWNGGIGTVVKASDESDADARDRSSDAIRVDAADLRARVVGEGGNLGFTQRARIEYAAPAAALHQRRLHRQLGRGRLLRPRGQPEDPARPRGAPRRARARRSATSCCTRSPPDVVAARALRLVPAGPDPGAGGARLGGARLRLRGPDAGRSRTRDMLRRADEALPSTDEMAERRRAGPGLERPELAVLARLRQAAADRRAAGLRPARRPGLRARPARLLPARGGRPLRPPHRRAPAAPRAGRDAGGQRRRQRARPDVRQRPGARARRRAGRGRSRVPDRARGHRRDAPLAGDRGPRHDAGPRGRVAAARRRRRPGRRRHALVPAARAAGADLQATIAAGSEAFVHAGRGDARACAPRSWREEREAEAQELMGAGVPAELARAHALPDRAAARARHHRRRREKTGRDVRAVAGTFFELGERLGLEWLEQEVLRPAGRRRACSAGPSRRCSTTCSARAAYSARARSSSRRAPSPTRRSRRSWPRARRRGGACRPWRAPCAWRATATSPASRSRCATCGAWPDDERRRAGVARHRQPHRLREPVDATARGPHRAPRRHARPLRGRGQGAGGGDHPARRRRPLARLAVPPSGRRALLGAAAGRLGRPARGAGPRRSPAAS